MKPIYLLIASLILAVYGTLLYAMQKNDIQNQTNHFLQVEQYQPRYMKFTDDEMLYECDSRGLVYDYENGICTRLES